MITNKKATPRATRLPAQAIENNPTPDPLPTDPAPLPYSTAHAFFAIPEQLGLTQKEFCLVFGLHYGDFRKLKCGQSQMGIEQFTSMMTALSQVYALMRQVRRLVGGPPSVDPAKALAALQKKRAACEAKWQMVSARHQKLKQENSHITLGIQVLAEAQSFSWVEQSRDLLHRKLEIQLVQLEAKLNAVEERIARLDHRLARYRRQEKELQEKLGQTPPKKRSFVF